MKNKKGFTLVEVLAVVIILGVIASITYPIIKNTIDTNRKKGFASSLEGVVRTTEMYLADNALISDVIIGYNDEKIKTENNHFISGIVDYKDGEIYLKGFSDGQYCANGVSGNFDIEERDCTALENAAVPVDSCFEFDTTTGTITRYNYTDANCPSSIILPEKINGVSIKHIGDHAFIRGVNLANYVIVGSKDINGKTIYDIIENIGTTKYKEEIKTITSSSPQKKCYTNATNINLQNISLFLDETFSELYIYCDLDPTTLEEYTDYRGIESIDLSYAKELRTIGKYAFANGDLRYITFGELSKLETIERFAFKNCSLTGTVDMSGLTNLKSIMNDAFMGNNINKLILPNGIDQIGEYAFMSNWIEEVDLSELSVTFIGANAFRDNRISSVSLPNSLTTILDGAFRNNSISKLTIGSNLTSIPQYAFASNQIGNLVIPSAVTSIGYYAFSMALAGNSSIVTIGSGISSMDATSFHCSSASTCAYTININKTSGTALNQPWGNSYATINWAGSF